MKRKEIIKNFSEFDSSGVQLVFTRQGIEVTGWFDHYCGIQGGFIPWSEVDKIRRQLNQKESGEREDNDV